MKSFLCFFIFVIAFHLSHSQCTFSLSGKVIDAHDKKPLEFAQLYIPELNISATSDTLGYYIIKGICEGTYTVYCRHFGCDSVKEIIKIDRDVKKNFYPEHHAHELSLIAVSSSKAKELPNLFTN
jgi:iron complex outermembrane recepter protein